MSDFTSISKKYESDSVVQKSAGEILLDMLAIEPNSTILDLGCGTGHITQQIREMTKGTIIGVDPSPGMIQRADSKFADKNISFMNLAADQMDFQETFDVIFCNSAFQWFSNPDLALEKCYRALKPNGKIGIQAPAKNNYCPNFMEAVKAVSEDSATATIFRNFASPWFFLDSGQEYSLLFEGAGFTVTASHIEKVETPYPVEEVFKIFESGAAAGYLNQLFYSTELTTDYRSNFRNIVLNSFKKQADDQGTINLIFYRIYLLAVKGR